MIKEKYNQWRLSYQIGRIRTIGYIHKLCDIFFNNFFLIKEFC